MDEGKAMKELRKRIVAEALRELEEHERGHECWKYASPLKVIDNTTTTSICDLFPRGR